MVWAPSDYIWVGFTFPLIAVAAVILRLWVVGRYSRSRYGLDDWFILVAAIIGLGDGVSLALSAIIGIGGRDYDVIPPGRNAQAAKTDFVTEVIEKAWYGLIKLSVLLFFRRFFMRHLTFRILNNLLIVFVSLWTLAFTFTVIFICGKDVWKVYTPNMHGTTNGCGDLNKVNLAYAITDSVTDIMVLALPYPFIRKLQMNIREKIGITAIFLLGTIAIAASLVRLGVIAQAFVDGFGTPGNHHNQGAAAIIFSTIEGCTGIVAACLPPMAPLIRKAPIPKKIVTSIANALPSSKRASSAATNEKSRAAISKVISQPDSQSSGPRDGSRDMLPLNSITYFQGSRETMDV